MIYLKIFTTMICLSAVFAGRASKWSYCGCSFNPWQSWSACTVKCGGGSQIRERSVHHTIKPGCDKYEDCATGDTAYERRVCNDICYHGGTVETFGGYYSYCNCPTRWKGSCCDEEVNCGNPGSVIHGTVIGSQYFYGSTVTYRCDSFYNLTRGHSTQTCTAGGYWSGNKPLCLFAHTCHSNPCQNGGICIDELERYDCRCTTGWDGVNCEIDVQPPVMTECPNNISVTISKPTVTINWTEPHFTDPMNTRLETTTNYPTNRWEFRWGDFTVQYVATKPSNGLQTECTFQIKVRPHTCKPLTSGFHSAKICTNWKTDFGQYCMVFCDETHTLLDESDYNKFFVCGASGVWSPANELPKCGRDFDPSVHIGRQQAHYDTCNNTTRFSEVKEQFLMRLNASEFSIFCTKYHNECQPNGLSVSCN